MTVKRMSAMGIGLVLALTWFAAMSAARAQDEKVELKLELPMARWRCTPMDIRAPNMEAKDTEHAPVKVPKGLVNLALHKPVTSSWNEPPIMGELLQVTDGEKDLWQEGNYVELGPDLQWVQIDLGAACEVFAVAVWHDFSNSEVFHDVVIQCADDPSFAQGVQTLFNNDHDNSAKLGVGKSKTYIETNAGRVIDAKGVKTRCIRLYSNGNTGNDLNHYTEVEVWGRPAN